LAPIAKASPAIEASPAKTTTIKIASSAKSPAIEASAAETAATEIASSAKSAAMETAVTMEAAEATAAESPVRTCKSAALDRRGAYERHKSDYSKNEIFRLHLTLVQQLAAVRRRSMQFVVSFWIESARALLLSDQVAPYLRGID
jgi:hypothetical protein